MLNILARRHENVGIQIYPAQVQGETAAAEVAAGIKHFNRAKTVDVIIIARGGGSIEDLAAFNDEALARTIFASTLPVISAVGHETDFTIADFVADLRAPTPSAAAELVIESKHRLAEHLAHLHQRLGRATRYRLLMARTRLQELGAARRFCPDTGPDGAAVATAGRAFLSPGGKLSHACCMIIIAGWILPRRGCGTLIFGVRWPWCAANSMPALRRWSMLSSLTWLRDAHMPNG